MADPNRPENELKNTIDVQLNLFKENEVQSLAKLFDQFRTSVNALQVLGTVADRLAAAGSTDTPYTAGNATHASRSPKSQIKPDGSKEQADENEKRQNRLSRYRDTAHQQAYDWLYKGEHAQRNISNLLLRGELKDWRMKDYAGLAGYGLGRAYFRGGDPLNPNPPGGRIGGALLGGGAAMLGLEATGKGPLSMLYGGVNLQGQTAYGTNAGMSGIGGGFLGINPFGMFSRLSSPAFGSYLGSQFNAVQNAAAGFPFYSFGQSQEAQGLINQLGYASSDNVRGQMSQVFRNVSTQVPAIKQSQTGQMLDMGYRYGAASIQEMQQQILEIPQAAHAAQMGVQQFTDELIKTAVSVSQTTGGAAASTTAQLLSLSSATGVAPAVAGGLMTSQILTNITAAKNGGNFWQAATSPFAGASRLGTMQSIIEQITGHSWKELGQLQKSNPKAYSRVMNSVYLVWKSNPALFGNMTPAQINGLIGRGGSPAQFAHATAALDFVMAHPNAAKNTGADSIATIMRNLGMSHSQQVGFLRQHGSESYISKIKELQGIAKQREEHMNKRSHSPQVQVGLTPDARKLLRIIPNDSPATRNQNENLSDLAVRVGDSAIYGAH